MSTDSELGKKAILQIQQKWKKPVEWFQYQLVGMGEFDHLEKATNGTD